jgi:DNA-binding CsgD family transcriptional regulator/ArsR family metal-binding transcriptional regulator
MADEAFSEFSLSRTGVLVSGWFGAYFRLKKDVRSVFPYINAFVTESRYYDRPEHIQFFFDGIKCTLYPHELIAASFPDEGAALSFFGRFMTFVEDLLQRRDTLQPDYRKYHPPAILDILKLVPKSNCRSCGYATCMAFAAALRNGEVAPDSCPDFASPINVRKIYPVFDEKGNLSSTVTIDIDTMEETAAGRPENRLVPTDPNMKVSDRSRRSPPDSPAGGNIVEDVMMAELSEADMEMGTPPLTRREIQVLKYITGGATNIEIADHLCLSPHTVKSHVIHIFNKLGVNDRTQAAVWATRHLENGSGGNKG